MSDILAIGDTLVDHEKIRESKHRFMMDSFENYKRANSLLGYFSELRDYQDEYDRLSLKVNKYRSELLLRYQDILTSRHPDIFKQILVSPTYTKWYSQGISKYKKVRNYSMYYYRRKIYIALEEDHLDITQIKKIVDTVIALDKYYDIYDETIEYIMKTSSKFDHIMRKYFSECIHI